MNVPCWKSGVFSGISKYALTKNQSNDTIMSPSGYISISNQSHLSHNLVCFRFLYETPLRHYTILSLGSPNQRLPLLL